MSMWSDRAGFNNHVRLVALRKRVQDRVGPIQNIDLMSFEQLAAMDRRERADELAQGAVEGRA